MSLTQLANKLIPSSNGQTVLKKKGDTTDIIAEVLSAFKDSRGQLQQFAPHLKADNLQQTLNNVWKFWKYQIRYQVDPEGVQWVQEPKALWQRKVGDCKSLSVAVMATLHELGIKASFRFACYNPAIDFPTHVYVVVLNNGLEIPVDCVWKEFGTQKQFAKKWDYNMTAIYRLSGVQEDNGNNIAGRRKGNARKNIAMELFIPGSTVIKKVLKNSKPTDFLIPGSRIFRKLLAKRKKKRGIGDTRGVLNIPDNATDDVVALLLDKQYLEMQQIKSAKVHGIGNTYDRAYEMDITAHHNAVAELMGLPQRHCVGYGEPVHPQNMVDGLPANFTANLNKSFSSKKGKANKKKFLAVGKKKAAGSKKLSKATKRNASGKAVSKRQAKLLEKSGVAVNKRKEGLVKRVGKGLKKIVKAPARLAVRSQLPKSAPFFLYTFITDEKILAKLPEQVAIKRQKALNYKRIIIDKLEMPEANFEKAVRNGIMNAFAKSPEEVLAKWMKDANFQIGIVPIVAAAFGALKGLLKLAAGKAAANLKADVENFSPAPEDWGAIPGDVKEDLSNQVRNQETNTDPGYRTPTTEKDFFENNGAGDDGSGGGYGTQTYSNRGNNADDATGDTKLNDEKEMQNVEVTAGKAGKPAAQILPGDEEPKKDNSMLWLGLAVVGVAAVALGGKASKKKRA